MSAAANETPAETTAQSPESQDDSAETKLEYGSSKGIPWWLAMIWLTFMSAAVIYVARLYVPALRAWLGQ